MRKFKFLIPAIAVIILSFFLSVYASDQEETAKQYEASWESLIQKDTPEWLKDAKFGIYAHWGIYSIGIGPPWTGKHLHNPEYQKGKLLGKFEKLMGGSLKDGFGYTDMIPYFKAEKYDPAAWADLVKKSKAKFAGFSIAHHDGFGLWDSDVYKWNVGKMGPKRDLYGDFVKELRKLDIKIYATGHMFRTYNWMNPPKKYIEQAKKENWDVVNPKYKDFYWSDLTGGDKAEFYKLWNLKIREVIDKYHPDLFWFDGGQYHENKKLLNTFAYYYNEGEKQNQDVYITNKLPTTRRFNFPVDFGVYNFESGRDRPVEVRREWLDDLNITGKGWGYTGYEGAHSSNYVIRQLIDNVSRGGGLIVSLAPRLDGSIPDAQQQTLIETGAWLEDNGEAIFGTRRWLFSADESRKETAENYIYKYSPQKENTRWNFEKMPEGSIRYTKKGDDVYILTMGIPKENVVVAKRLASNIKLFYGQINEVSLLGFTEKIKWERTVDGLVITLPEDLPNDKALAFKVTLQNTGY